MPGTSRTGTSWLGPALAVALLWAPLPGMAALWFSVRAEGAREDGGEVFAAAAARARLWVGIAVLFGLVEGVGFGSIGLVRMAIATWSGGAW